MQDIIINGCRCTCESVQSAAENSATLDYLRIGLVVLVVVMLVLGIIVAYKKMSKEEDKNKKFKF